MEGDGLSQSQKNKFDYAVIEIMHAQWGFHKSIAEAEVRFANHKNGASNAVTAGRDELPLEKFSIACPDDWDKAYIPERRNLFGVTHEAGWYYFKAPYDTKGEPERPPSLLYPLLAALAFL